MVVGEDELQARIRELGKEITADYEGRPPLLVGVLKGAFVFMSDLSRAIDLPVEFDFMAVSSYGSATRSSGVVRILKDLDLDLTDRHVLIVEDIVDSGLTLAYLRKNLAARGPASLEVCALLVKEGLQQRRARPEVRRLHASRRRSSSATASTWASATATCPYIAEYAGPNRSERTGSSANRPEGRPDEQVDCSGCRLSPGVAVPKQRRSLVIVVVVVAVVAAFFGFRALTKGDGPQEISLDRYTRRLDDGKVATATVHDKDHTVTGELDGRHRVHGQLPRRSTPRAHPGRRRRRRRRVRHRPPEPERRG